MLAFLSVVKSQGTKNCYSLSLFFCIELFFKSASLPTLQLPRIALMKHFVWLMDQLRVQAEWRSASMECGEQCVTIVVVAGITMMPELCADNWDTV